MYNLFIQYIVKYYYNYYNKDNLYMEGHIYWLIMNNMVEKYV